MEYQPDQNFKHHLFNYYKNLSNAQRKRREEEKRQRINDEKELLRQKEQRGKEYDQQIFQNNQRKKLILKNEYLNMLKKNNYNISGFHLSPKPKYIISKNWGKTKEESINSNTNILGTPHRTLDISQQIQNFEKLNNNEKEKHIIIPVDHMNDFLTDEQNGKEINLYFEREKMNKQKYFRDVFFSQFDDYNKNNMNKYGTEDFIIMKHRKGKIITDNPYRKCNKYEIGQTNLKNNPILNPEDKKIFSQNFVNNFLPAIMPKNNSMKYMLNQNLYSFNNHNNITQINNNNTINNKSQNMTNRNISNNNISDDNINNNLESWYNRRNENKNNLGNFDYITQNGINMKQIINNDNIFNRYDNGQNKNFFFNNRISGSLRRNLSQL